MRSHLKSVLKALGIGLLILCMTVKGPELHYNYIRNKIQKTVVMVTNAKKNSGGSGTHVKTSSGRVYILTNAHVCGVGKDGIVYITDDYGRTIPRRIIEVSPNTDLCLVEPLPNYQGSVNLGSQTQPGQIVAVVGHPSLMPTTMSRGEIIGEDYITVMDHVMNPFDSNDKCDLPKNKIVKVETLFGDFNVCTLYIKAIMSNVIILPGNSGSPVVNFYGNLVGLVFAGNRAGWGMFVTLNDIQEFLRPY